MKILFLPILFLGFMSPLYSETDEDNQNLKYSFYEKCMKSDNSSVSKCLKESNEKLDSLIQKKYLLRAIVRKVDLNLLHAQ